MDKMHDAIWGIVDDFKHPARIKKLIAGAIAFAAVIASQYIGVGTVEQILIAIGGLSGIYGARNES